MSRRKISRNNSRMSVDSAKYPKLYQDFELGESLGHGGFGQIVKAKHKCDKNEYAIKIIRFDSNMEDAGKNRREASNLSNLSHNHIVRYYNSWIETARIPLSEYNEMVQSDSEDSLSIEISKLSENGYINTEYNDTDNDDENEHNLDMECDSLVTFQSTDDIKEVQFLCIQMELCEKSTLREAIDDNLYLEEDRLNKYFRGICEGLSHIHNHGIVHRDLKPENIFLTSGDVIKIGDFGLSKQIALVDEIENLTSDDLPYGSLTGICGTRIYIAPEFFSERNLFNNKADIYSLGVIYFEMCTRPMTEMEKCLQFPMTLQKLKNTQFPKKSSKKRDLIKSMLHPNYNERPSCEDILKIIGSEKSQGEIKEMMQQTKKVPYPQVKAFKKVLEGNGIEKCDLMSLFTRIAVEIFEVHGGHNITIPTFLPSFNNRENCDNLTPLLNIHGNSISISNKSRIGFSHYVQANHLEALRRYSVGKIFEEGYFLPAEKQECIFEVISPKPDYVTDAEILYMAKEMCSKVSKDEKNEIYININHRLIYQTILKNSGITNDDANLFTNIMVKLSRKMPNDIQYRKLILSLKFDSKNFTEEFLQQWQPCAINLVETKLIAKMKGKKLKMLVTAFNELEMIVENLNKFGIDTKYISLAPLLITDKCCSGFMFKVYLMNPQIVIATGDRFDSLINRYVKRDMKHRKEPKHLTSIGISFHVDNILKLLISSDALKCLMDVVIYIGGHTKQKAIPLLMKLMAESIKCQIISEVPPNLLDSSYKPPKVLINLYTENVCRVYVTKESNMTSNRPWSSHLIYNGSWANEIFINIIKEHIAKSKTTSQMSIHLPLTL